MIKESHLRGLLGPFFFRQIEGPKKMNKALWTISAAALIISGCDNQQPPSALDDGMAADTVVINAQVYTDGTSGSLQSGFAVSDGVFVAVGSNEAVEAYIGPNTDIINAQGNAVLPGLIDAHAHPWQGGEKVLYMCNFAFSATPDELASTIKRCAEDPSGSEWIVGGQWNSNFFVDNDIDSPRAFLDAVSNGHPVFLDDDSAHHGWANTRALALAGVALSADTADPEGGKFVRDAAGVPNGVLLESAAGFVSSVIPPRSDEEKIAAIAAVSDIALGYGVTAFGDARVPKAAMAAYQAADERGLLNVHAVLYQQSYGHGADWKPLEPVAAYDARAAQFNSPNTYGKAIKFFLDGVPTASRSAMMLADYTTDEKHPEPTKGMQMIATDDLFNAVAAFDRDGYLIKIHTAGDGSVKLALDAIEHTRRENGSGGLPISLAHAGYVDESDIPRFAALNAVADFTPYLWYPRPIIDSVIQSVGEPRGSRYWPTKDLLAAGAPINGGSDWPAAAADMNPWPAIESLVTRRHPTNGSDETFWLEQAVSLDTAMSMWTTRSADVMNIGDLTGSITVGKSADFIVLDVDLHQIPIEAISEIAPQQTWFKGRMVAGER